MASMGYSRTRGQLFMKKALSRKSRGQTSFKSLEAGASCMFEKGTIFKVLHPWLVT
jgi:hypothetical protein